MGCEMFFVVWQLPVEDVLVLLLFCGVGPPGPAQDGITREEASPTRLRVAVKEGGAQRDPRQRPPEKLGMGTDSDPATPACPREKIYARYPLCSAMRRSCRP